MYSRLTEKLYMSPLRLYCIGNFILKDFQIVHRVGLSTPDTRSEPYKPTGFATNEKRVALQSLSTVLDLSERIIGRGETAGKLRERQRAKYFVDGMQLGRDTFKFVHAYVFALGFQ